MKIETAVGQIEKSGNLVEHVAKMEMNEVAFEVLSGGIYTDRETAIIRELSCNAVDAHVDAGNLDTPFLIRLPNSLEPHLIIRDYGTGLPADQIPNLYLYYFRSTKAQSNDFIGAMGLGAKSPFSYVDSFHVSSYYEGKKYNFVAYKNEQNCAACTLMETEDTNEPNGLEIKISIPATAHYEFFRKTAQALRFFKYKPTVEGIDHFNWPNEVEYFLESPKFGICRSRQSSLVIMGGVAYPFSSKDFAGEFELTSAEKKVMNQGIHFFVPLGAVRPNAGRERLTYNNNTKIYLRSIIKEAVAALEKLSHENIKNAKSVWEARLKFDETKKGVLGEIFEFQPTFQFMGKEISDTFDFCEMDKGFKPRLIEIAGFGLEHHDDSPSSGSRRRRRNHNEEKKAKFRHFELTSIKPADVESILINDVERGGYKIIEKYLDDENIKNTVVFSADVSDEFLNELDCADMVIRVSTLPKPERAKRGSRGVIEKTLMQRWDFNNECWINEEEVDLNEGGIYVLIRHNKINSKGIVEGYFEDKYDFKTRVSHLRKFGFDEPIYAIRPCDLKRIARYSDCWNVLYEEIEEVVEENILYAEDCSLYDTWRETENNYSDYKHFENVTFSPNSPMAELMKKYKELKVAANMDAGKINSFRRLNEYVKNMYSIEMDAKVIDQMKTIWEQYPFLDNLSLSCCKMDDLIEYVNFIDSKQKAVAA